eukprot:TRINITY_DN7367_c0_g1_i1.p1 TRINITY_DN7367_c0_g1~~TRINITY_DN7367_c0_g1_i1.p1  ORF type:complete len:596 (+),score=96.94 TRINITY_DN7367_c0_g1_i1:241-2028(+)
MSESCNHRLPARQVRTSPVDLPQRRQQHVSQTVVQAPTYVNHSTSPLPRVVVVPVTPKSDATPAHMPNDDDDRPLTPPSPDAENYDEVDGVTPVDGSIPAASPQPSLGVHTHADRPALAEAYEEYDPKLEQSEINTLSAQQQLPDRQHASGSYPPSEGQMYGKPVQVQPPSSITPTAPGNVYGKQTTAVAAGRGAPPPTANVYGQKTAATVRPPRPSSNAYGRAPSNQKRRVPKVVKQSVAMVDGKCIVTQEEKMLKSPNLAPRPRRPNSTAHPTSPVPHGTSLPVHATLSQHSPPGHGHGPLRSNATLSHAQSDRQTLPHRQSASAASTKLASTPPTEPPPVRSPHGNDPYKQVKLVVQPDGSQRVSVQEPSASSSNNTNLASTGKSFGLASTSPSSFTHDFQAADVSHSGAEQAASGNSAEPPLAASDYNHLKGSEVPVAQESKPYNKLKRKDKNYKRLTFTSAQSVDHSQQEPGATWNPDLDVTVEASGSESSDSEDDAVYSEIDSDSDGGDHYLPMEYDPTYRPRKQTPPPAEEDAAQSNDAHLSAGATDTMQANGIAASSNRSSLAVSERTIAPPHRLSRSDMKRPDVSK